MTSTFHEEIPLENHGVVMATTAVLCKKLSGRHEHAAYMWW